MTWCLRRAFGEGPRRQVVQRRRLSAGVLARAVDGGGPRRRGDRSGLRALARSQRRARAAGERQQCGKDEPHAACRPGHGSLPADSRTRTRSKNRTLSDRAKFQRSMP